MTEPDTQQFETVLRQCEKAAPNPWYPSAYAKENGISRDTLDPHLDELRVAGHIRLTEWMPENGQGYVLTEAGQKLLKSPRQLAKLRKGTVPAGAPIMGEVLHPIDSPWERGDAIRGALIDPIRPRVTLVLLFLNIAWFVCGLGLAAQRGLAGEYLFGFGGGRAVTQVFHTIGAIQPSDLEEGQWWRLLTCCFVHFGVIHLGMNMFFLWVTGQMVEPMWGHVRYLTLYLLSGFGGSCAMTTSLSWRAVHGFEPSGAGASGALWGVMLAMAGWIYLNRTYLPAPLVSDWLRRLRNCILLNFLIGFAPGISMAGHLGGGAVGLVAAVLLNHHRFSEGWQRLPPLLGLFGLPVLSVALMLRFQTLAVPDLDRAQFPQQLVVPVFPGVAVEQFARAESIERAALRFYEGQAQALITQGPNERDAGDVERAISGLEREALNLKRCADLLEMAGAQPNARLESARRVRRRLLLEESKWFDTSARSLKAGGDSADGQLVQQLDAVKRARSDWNRVKNYVPAEPLN